MYSLEDQVVWYAREGLAVSDRSLHWLLYVAADA